MEARVKERLTGAVVLVAIVVIVVPELLSGPKHRVPPPAGSHTVKIDLNGPHRLTPAAPAAAAAETGVAAVPADGVAPRAGGEVVPAEAAPPPATEPETVADIPAPPPETESVPGDPEPPAAARKGTVPVVPAPAAPARSAALKAPPPAPRSAAAAVPPPPSSTPVAVAGWVVQLGSFASRENAQKLVTELQHKGYSAFIAEYRGHDKVLFRVRIGPEQDRGRADALRLRLGHDGYNGTVTPHP